MVSIGPNPTSPPAIRRPTGRRRRKTIGGRLDQDEVLLLWRALLRFRSGRNPLCAPQGSPPKSECPLCARCPRWSERDDRELSLDEDFEETERRQDAWPCSRIMGLLDPEVNWIGQRRR
jgi:hypothetical protein